MDGGDRDIRNLTYRLFVELGRAPTAAEVGEGVGQPATAVLESWRRLHDGHALVLNAAGTDIRMANPFAAAPTAHRVEAGGRWWYANCAWDALGIPVALGVDGRIETSCPDCGEAVSLAVRDGAVDRDDLVFHCLVPAARWWDDIAFT